MDWKVIVLALVVGTIGALRRRTRVTTQSSDEELARIRLAAKSRSQRQSTPSRVPEWVHRPSEVEDPPVARWSAIGALVTFVLAGAGFLIGYSDHRPHLIDVLHGLTIIAVPILLLVAVVSRARAKETAALVIRDERYAFGEQVRRMGDNSQTSSLLGLLAESEVVEDAGWRLEVIRALVHTRDEVASTALITALSDDDELVRREAAIGLGGLKARAAIPALGALLTNRFEGRAVARALVEIRDGSGVPVLEAASRTVRSPLRRRFLDRAADDLRRSSGMTTS